MSEIVNQSLQKIAKGTSIVFFGTVFGLLLGFGIRVLLARFFTQSEYGIFSLALALLSIFALISTLGFQDGSTRQIAFYRGKGDMAKVQGVIASSLQMPLIVSIMLSIILFFASSIISTKIFHEPGLSNTLKVFSIAIPFLTLIHIFSSIFRGFDEVRPGVYFENILKNVFFLCFLVPIILLSLPFHWAMYAFSTSLIITCMIFIAYATKRAPFLFGRRIQLSVNPVGKELLLIALPLLATAMLGMVMGWMDTLMLGYFKTSNVVGLYNGALPLAHLIPIVLGSMGFIYIPITSQFYSQNLVEEMKRNYAILTKWVFAITLPLFFLFFLFPGTILNFLFGSQYIKASVVLQILALGFFILVFLGPNGATLVSIGKTRTLMWAALLGAILNIILNISLIPTIGIIGAAIASAISLAIASIVASVRLYQVSEIHPFTKNYLKFPSISVAAILIIYALARNSLTVTVWMLPIIFILFLMMHTLALLLTKSFDREDIVMLLEVERRAGIDLSLVKKLLKRFV